jgi:hypothetical protein
LAAVWSHAGQTNSILLYFLYDIITYAADSFSSPKIIQVIKSRRTRWVGHLAHMGERKGVYYVQGFGGETKGKETTWKTQV